jgi:hypothetical protein
VKQESEIGGGFMSRTDGEKHASENTTAVALSRSTLSLTVNRDVEASPPIDEQPPLVETADPPEGLLEIKIRDSRGNRIGLFQVDAAYIDNQITNALKAWEARHSGSASLSLG